MEAEVEPLTIEVTQERHITIARKAAFRLAQTLGLSEMFAHSVATSVSELANNLFSHTCRGGAITLTALPRGIEVIAEDDGPGIPDTELAMRDGFSTNGGLGGGLPGVRRLMDQFELVSAAGAGTRIVARKWQRSK